MNRKWMQTAITLDQKMGDALNAFLQDIVKKDIDSPVIQKQYGMLDYFVLRNLPALMTLDEQELFLVLFCSDISQIPVNPETRERLNKTYLTENEINFKKIIQILLQAEVDREYSKILNETLPFKLLQPKGFNDFSDQAVMKPIITGREAEYSEEECYIDYCSLICRMLRTKDDKEFLQHYEMYYKIRDMIRKGKYPIWITDVSADKYFYDEEFVCLNRDEPFITDCRICRHFRLACMFLDSESEETIALRWKDILEYPSVLEIFAERRAALLNADKTSYYNYLSRKLDMLRSIWVADYHILKEYRNKEEQKLGNCYFRDNLKQIWRENRRKLSSYMNLSYVQRNYDNFLEGEARLAIYSCMEAIDGILGKRRQIKDIEELKLIGEKIEQFCQKEYNDLIKITKYSEAELSSMLNEELNRKDFLFRKETAENKNFLQRYYLSGYLLENRNFSMEERSIYQEFYSSFEKRMAKDVNKIMEYWLNHNLILTNWVVCKDSYI